MPKKHRRVEDTETGESGSELRVLYRMLALAVIEGKKQKDQVRLLSLAGLDRNEIAELVGTTPLTVSVALSNMRKEGAIRARKHKRKVPGE